MSEISFGTGGWRTTLENFTDKRIRMVAQGVATYLRENQEEDDRAVVVGYDARKKSKPAAEIIANVFTKNGFDVFLPNRDLPTPVIAHAIANRNLSGGVIVTASHNPPNYNGIKFVPSSTASPMPEVTNAIESHIARPSSQKEYPVGTVNKIDPVSAHADRSFALTNKYFGTDLSDLTIVYDGMHGSGRGVTDKLLESAGADVIRLRCTRDHTFGGTAPEPNQETLNQLPIAVKSADADLGIANDGDGDRISISTPERGVLSGHLLFAGLYEALLNEGNTDGPAIRTVSTSNLIDRIANDHDTRVYEVPVGFKWIADGMSKYNALLGGEESGGFTIRGHIGEKDGVFIALLVAAITDTEPFDARLDRIFERYGRVYADKLSVECTEKEKEEVLTALADNIPKKVAGQPVINTNSLDGFKLLLEGGSWILIRPSGTEPKMRVAVETPEQDLLTSLLSEGQRLVEELIDK